MTGASAVGRRTFVPFLIAAMLFVPTVLLCDGSGLMRQLSLSLATIGFLFLFVRYVGAEVRQVLCAIAVATLGELTLSIGWGLYSYRFALLPLYVPFGHGLFFALAAATARQPFVESHGRRITRGVLAGGSVIALVSLVLFDDWWGLLWWIGASLLILRSRNAALLSVCFIYTMLLEWLGTALGNWHWAATVPFVGLHSANPPSGVGILYVVLDLITVAICARLGRRDAGVPVGEDAGGPIGMPVRQA